MPTREQVHNPQHDHGEAVPTAAERMSFYHGATKEAMNDRGRSVAELDKASGASEKNWSDTLMKTAPQVEADMQRLRNRRVADYATRAANYGDVVTGRKKVVTEDDPLPKYKDGGVVPRTGPAIVHKGELIIPAGEVHSTAKAVEGGTMRCLPLPDRVVSDADRLAAKGYTGANAPWRR